MASRFKTRVCYLIVAVMVSFFVGLVANNGAVFAASVSVPDAVKNKMVYQGLLNCFGAGGVVGSINLGEYKEIKDLGTSNISVVLASGMDDGTYNTDGKATYSCKTFLGGSNSIKPISSFTGVSTPTNKSGTGAVVDFMKAIGYDVTEVTSGSCSRLAYTYYVAANTGSAEMYTNKVCVNSDSSVIVDDSGTKNLTGAAANYAPKFDISNSQICFHISGIRSCTSIDDYKKLNEADRPVALLSLVTDSVVGCGSSSCVIDVGGGTRFTFVFNADRSSTLTDNSLNNFTATFDRRRSLAAVSYFSNGSVKSVADTKIADDSFGKRQLYQNYYTQYYGMSEPSNCGGDVIDSDLIAINWANSNSVNKCYYSQNELSKNTKRSNKVNGIEGGVFKQGSLDLQGLIDAINQLPAEYDDITAADVNENTSEAASENSCLAADLNGQGWWLCSTLENLRYTANPMDNMIDSMLTTDTDLYNYDSPTHSVWEIMRNIANIFMIIFLLVIIISQITGYGISNYGIKKMLPRFIVIAILINLSFVISSVAVDLSNLLGVGLRNLFGGIGSSLNSTGGVRDFIDAMVGGLLASVGLVGGSAATIITIIAVLETGDKTMLIVLIVLALLVVVVAIGIFLAMLGARAIIIIGCVAISPVAFALYVLPNTQNIFKKWWSLFKAALVIYPICGAVGGISYLIKAVIYGSKGFHPLMGIVVLISPYLVFFMLPTLLKGAITALGSVGAALTQAGESFKRGIAKSSEAIQNTERFKAGMSEVNRSRNLGTANKTIGQLREKQKSGIPLTPFEKRRLAAAGQTVDKLKAEDRAANTAIAMMDLKDQDLDYANGQLTDAIMSGDTDRIEAVSSAMFSLHGTQAVDSIAAVLDNLEVKNGEIDGMTLKNNKGEEVRVSAENAAMALSAFRDLQVHDSNASGIIRSKASDAWQMIANRGYGADGKMHDLEWHSAHNGIATQDADWASQNSTTLKRSRDAAKKYTDLGDETVSGLTKERAESLLNSSDNNIKSTILSEAGKVDILEKVVNPSGGTAENVVTQAVSDSNGGGGSNNGTIVIRDGGNNGGGDNSNLAQEMRQVEQAIDSMSDQIQAGAAEVSSSIRNNSGAPSGTPQTVTNSGNGKVISTRGYTDDSGVHHREKKMSNGEVIDEVG